MNRNEKIGLTILGMTVIGLVFVNHKINRTLSIGLATLEVVDTMLDLEIQEEVDEKFAEIVENYED